MVQKLRPHEAVRVKAGKAAGLVGVVMEVEGERVRVQVHGVKDGEPVNVDGWLSVKSVERAQ